MKSSNIIESSYFHIHNGGLTLNIVEQTHTWESPVLAKKDGSTTSHISKKWEFEAVLSSFGHSVRASFPLGGPVVEWTIGALQRILARMVKPSPLATDGVEFSFSGLRYADVSRINGENAPPHPEKLRQFDGKAHTNAPISEDIKR
jgi:hypothetical protein